MRKTRYPRLVFCSIQLILLFELSFYPMSAEQLTVPGTVHALAQCDDSDPVFVFNSSSAQPMFFQTIHHHPINGGYIARIADDDQSRQLNSLNRIAFQHYLKKDDIIDRKAACDFVWSDEGFGYIHCPKWSDILPELDKRPLSDQIKEAIPYKVIAEDEQMILFRIPEYANQSPVLEFAGGWGELISVDKNTKGRSIESKGQLIIRNPSKHTLTLDMTIHLLSSCRLRVLLNEKEICNRSFNGETCLMATPITIPLLKNADVNDGAVLSVMISDCSQPGKIVSDQNGILVSKVTITNSRTQG